MAWHDTPPWRARQAEREETMAQVAKVVEKWNRASISAVKAVDTIRELIEPVRVRVGGQHKPEVQS